MEAIRRELSGLVEKEFIQFILDKSAEMNSMTNATAECIKFFKSLDLFKPVDADQMAKNLTMYVSLLILLVYSPSNFLIACFYKNPAF
jgi:hypothetical protein